MVQPGGTERLALARKNFLEKYTRIASAEVDKEDAVHAMMPEHVASILFGKRLRILEMMMKEAGCSDSGLCDLIAGGVNLVGTTATSGEFTPMFKPASLSPDDLMAMCQSVRGRVLSRTMSQGTSALDSAVVDGTMEEVSKGWLSGPYTTADLDGMFDQKWIPSRRFAVQQSSKIRLIDDFSGSLVNSCVSTSEKIDLEHVDHFLAIAKLLFRAGVAADGCDDKPRVSSIYAKCFDLSSAYRQMPVAPSSYRFSIIVIWNHALGLHQYFVMRALPFGSVASVYAFLRVSRAIRHVMVRCLKIPAISYYDDFAVLACGKQSTSIQADVLSFFDLIGWKVTRDPRKTFDFAPVFDLLGVTIDFALFGTGTCQVRNKESRVLDLLQCIQSFLDARELTPGQAASLRGKLLFTEAQHYARIGCLGCRIIGDRAVASAKDNAINDELEWALKSFVRLLQTAPARTMSFYPAGQPYII
eukprot:6470635-Amphidinium_carterae.1